MCIEHLFIYPFNNNKRELCKCKFSLSAWEYTVEPIAERIIKYNGSTI